MTEPSARPASADSVLPAAGSLDAAVDRFDMDRLAEELVASAAQRGV
jgi:hypothetical protein